MIINFVDIQDFKIKNKGSEQNVIINLRCCFKFYGPRHFTLNLIFCCFTFCDKPNFLSLVRLL